EEDPPGPGPAGVVEVVHDRQRVRLGGTREPHGVGDPPFVAGAERVLLPAVLVAGLVGWPGAPYAPLLVVHAHVLQLADQVVPDTGGRLGEDVIHQVVEVLGGAVHV